MLDHRWRQHGLPVPRATYISCYLQEGDWEIPFRVLLDCEAPRPIRRVSTTTGGGVLRDGRLYQLVLQRDGVRHRTLEITFHKSGAEAYAFTFG